MHGKPPASPVNHTNLLQLLFCKYRLFRLQSKTFIRTCWKCTQKIYSVFCSKSKIIQVILHPEKSLWIAWATFQSSPHCLFLTTMVYIATRWPHSSHPPNPIVVYYLDIFHIDVSCVEQTLSSRDIEHHLLDGRALILQALINITHIRTRLGQSLTITRVPDLQNPQTAVRIYFTFIESNSNTDL